MKKIFLVFLVLFVFFSGCILNSSYGKLIFQIDSYRNSETVSLHLRFPTQEKRAIIYSVLCDFYAEKRGEKKQYKVFTTVVRSQGSFCLEDSFFMAIDEKKYQMAIEKNRIQLHSSVSETTENVMLTDSTKTTIVTGVSTETWKEEQFVIQFSDTQVAELLKCEQFSLRFYAGSSIGTIVVKNSDLAKIKKLLSSF